MADETRETVAAGISPQSALSPNQLIEDMVKNVSKVDESLANEKKQLIESIRQLEQCIVSRTAESAYADAVARAPWLTGDAEQLRRHWEELRESLHELFEDADQKEGSREALIEKFNAVAEEFGDCKADEQCLLQAAYPGPDWTNDNRGPF